MTGGRVSGNVAQADGMSNKTVHATVMISCISHDILPVGQMADQTALLGYEEGASRDMRGGRSDGRQGSMTSLDNALTVN